jgi:beta-mannosidase
VDVSTFAGAIIVSAAVPVLAGPATSDVVWSAPAAAVCPGPDRFAWVADKGGRIHANRVFFAPLRELPLGRGELDVSIERHGDGALVHLRSRGYSYFARVTAPAPGLLLSANCLDLRDGDAATIEVRDVPAGLDVHDLAVTGWRWSNRQRRG